MEIERRYIVNLEAWKPLGYQVEHICQGYLVRKAERSVRVRITGSGGWITVKGPTKGAVRAEYEYSIPETDARDLLLTLCLEPFIEKVRYTVPHEGSVFVVDEVKGDNAGLVLAEIELVDENEEFRHPEWIGDEVTGNPDYSNARLTKHPFSKW